jgi:hypothetical protein
MKYEEKKDEKGNKEMVEASPLVYSVRISVSRDDISDLLCSHDKRS